MPGEYRTIPGGQKDQQLAFFACSAGGSAEKCLQNLKKSAGSESVTATLHLVDPGKNRKEVDLKKIREFCSEIERAVRREEPARPQAE